MIISASKTSQVNNAKKIQKHLLSTCKDFREERQTVGYISWVFWWHFLLGGVFYFYSGLDFIFRANEMVQSTKKERDSEFGIQACFLAFLYGSAKFETRRRICLFFHESKLCCKNPVKFTIQYGCHICELGLYKLIEK